MTRSLIALLRQLSPRLRAVPATLMPDLRALLNTPLPRQPLAILFDVYGTLLASSAGGVADEPQSPTVQVRGKTKRAAALLFRELSLMRFKGGPTGFHNAVIQEIGKTRSARQGSLGSEVDIEALISKLVEGPQEQVRRLTVLYESWRNPCSAMPGAKRLLRKLAGRVRLGLVSNAQFYTPLLIEALLGTPRHLGFEEQLTVFSFQRGIAKPHPEAFSPALLALEADGIPPDRVLFVGNSAVNDVEPAQKLGLMTALFAGDARSYRPPPSESSVLPSTILERLADVWTVSFAGETFEGIPAQSS